MQLGTVEVGDRQGNRMLNLCQFGFQVNDSDSFTPAVDCPTCSSQIAKKKFDFAKMMWDSSIHFLIFGVRHFL